MAHTPPRLPRKGDAVVVQIPGHPARSAFVERRVGEIVTVAYPDGTTAAVSATHVRREGEPRRPEAGDRVRVERRVHTLARPGQVVVRVDRFDGVVDRRRGFDVYVRPDGEARLVHVYETAVEVLA